MKMVRTYAHILIPDRCAQVAQLPGLGAQILVHAWLSHFSSCSSALLYCCRLLLLLRCDLPIPQRSNKIRKPNQRKPKQAQKNQTEPGKTWKQDRIDLIGHTATMWGKVLKGLYLAGGGRRPGGSRSSRPQTFVKDSAPSFLPTPPPPSPFNRICRPDLLKSTSPLMTASSRERVSRALNSKERTAPRFTVSYFLPLLALFPPTCSPRHSLRPSYRSHDS